MSHKLEVFFDQDTYTLTYLVYDHKTKDALLIDPVWDYDPAASKVSEKSVQRVLDFIKSHDLHLHYVLETHAHADHLSGASRIKDYLPHVKIAIGENITKVQELFKDIFNLKNLNTKGSQFDILLNEKDVLSAGSIQVKTIFTPGHTPACSSYLIDDLLFTGDALFMPDYGTGRCDFPAGSAKELYHSVHEKLYKLPDETKVLTGHDYQPNGRKLKYESTIGESKRENIQLKESTSEQDFVEFRKKRDATLAAPRLLLPSIQVNINTGQLPEKEDNGISYLKIPVRN